MAPTPLHTKGRDHRQSQRNTRPLAFATPLLKPHKPMKQEYLTYKLNGRTEQITLEEVAAIEATGYSCFRDYAQGTTEDRVPLANVLRNSSGSLVAVKDNIEALKVVTRMVRLKRPTWGSTDQQRMEGYAMWGMPASKIAEKIGRPLAVVQQHMKATYR